MKERKKLMKEMTKNEIANGIENGKKIVGSR